MKKFERQKVSFRNTQMLLSRGRKLERNHVLYRCPKSHYYFLPTYYTIETDLYCPCCSSSMVKKDKVYVTSYLRELARKNSGSFLTGDYINKDFKYIWRCMIGHNFTRTINEVENGDWCLICGLIECYEKGNKRIAFGYERILKNKELIKERSEEFYDNKIDINEKFHISCKKGHKWESSIFNIFSLNEKCPFCNKKMKFYNIEYARKIAKKHKGRCLSRNYIDSITPLHWRCANMHTWDESLFSIDSQKRWCMVCFENGNI
jgi:hypothetical protein